MAEASGHVYGFGSYAGPSYVAKPKGKKPRSLGFPSVTQRLDNPPRKSRKVPNKRSSK